MTLQRINPPGPAFPAFSQGVRAGSWLVISGQVPLKDGVLVGPDAYDQAKQCFTNIAEVLATAGMSFAQVVKLSCFLTDAAAYPDYARAKREALGDAAPCGTGLIVAGLLVPGALMEVEAIAYCDEPR